MYHGKFSIHKPHREEQIVSAVSEVSDLMSKTIFNHTQTTSFSLAIFLIIVGWEGLEHDIFHYLPIDMICYHHDSYWCEALLCSRSNHVLKGGSRVWKKPSINEQKQLYKVRYQPVDSLFLDRLTWNLVWSFIGQIRPEFVFIFWIESL